VVQHSNGDSGTACVECGRSADYATMILERWSHWSDGWFVLAYCSSCSAAEQGVARDASRRTALPTLEAS